MSTQKYWRVTIRPEYQIWGICRDNEILAIGYPKRPDNFNVRRFRDEMSIGDRFVVYLIDFEIGGIGTITGDYRIDQVLFREHFWRTRKVRWDHRFYSGIDCRDRLSDKVLKRLHLQNTVQELSQIQFEEIETLLVYSI